MKTYIWFQHDVFAAIAEDEGAAIQKIVELAYRRKKSFLQNERLKLQSMINSWGEPNCLDDYFYADPIRELAKLTDDFIENHSRERANDVGEMLKENPPTLLDAYGDVNIIYAKA